MAQHYGIAVLPARPRKPRDKAKVENAVGVVERWILAALRHRKFFAVAELNEAIEELLERLNHRPFRKREGTRTSLFESIDRPALQPLPAQRYVMAEWKTVRANIDYHVEIDRHYYSVPYQLAGQQLEARYTATSIEVFQGGKRIASHARSSAAYRHTTVSEHMPKSHQAHLEWTPSRLIHWGETVGSATAEVIRIILASKPHPEMGYRACLGILRLAKTYSNERLEAASQRALQLQACSYSSLRAFKKGTPMLNQPTIEKLHTMKLHGMADAFRVQLETADTSQLGFEERFAMLVDQQWLWRENRALTRRLQSARLKERGVIEDIDYQHPRGLDHKLLRTLAASEWVRQNQNVLFIGPTGIGKSWLACALAHKACRDGFSVLHKRTTELFRELAVAHVDGSIGRVLLKLSRVDVLVLDDFAMAPLKDSERRDFLEICDDRYQRRSLILTSQMPIAHWHEQIGDPTIADSILDRLVHNAYRIELTGESMRKKRGDKPER
jgi:DNA replication protein DnaC